MEVIPLVAFGEGFEAVLLSPAPRRQLQPHIPLEAQSSLTQLLRGKRRVEQRGDKDVAVLTRQPDGVGLLDGLT